MKFGMKFGMSYLVCEAQTMPQPVNLKFSVFSFALTGVRIKGF